MLINIETLSSLKSLMLLSLRKENIWYFPLKQSERDKLDHKLLLSTLTLHCKALNENVSLTAGVKSLYFI